MPEPPEHREIEQLLRAYGQQRQEQAGPKGEMHPATRRLLLDEVRRVHGRTPAPAESSPKSWLQWLSLFWPRVGVAAALSLVLGGIIWISVRDHSEDHSQSAQLAQVDKVRETQRAAAEPLSRPSAPAEASPTRALQETPASPEPTTQSPAPPMVPAPAEPTPARMARSISRGRPSAAPPATSSLSDAVAVLSAPPAGSVAAPSQDEARAAATPPPLAPPQSQPADQPAFGAHLADQSLSPEVRSTQSPVVVAAAADAKAGEPAHPALTADTTPELDAARRLRTLTIPAPGVAGPGPMTFKNLAQSSTTGPSPKPNPGGAAAAPSPTLVLGTFSFLQTGEDIRIQDSDGSVYAGRVRQPPVSLERIVSKPETAPTAERPARLVFQARGTNRSLNKLVAIDATLVFAAPTNPFSYGITPLTARPVAQKTAASSGETSVLGFSAQANMPAPSLPPGPMAIEGTATVGSARPILLRAVQQQP